MSSYLGSRGYEVLGWGRNCFEAAGVDQGDCGSICDPAAVSKVIQKWRPEEIYHFAAHHHSSEQPIEDELDLFRQSVEVNLMSLLNFLQAACVHSPATRVFYAASSRVFGLGDGGMASEDTALAPVCPYGITKTAAVQACRYYRRRHSLHVSVGLMFNHESALRPAHYLSKKIIQGVLDIRRGLKQELFLGSLTSGADWGYAPDAMEKIHRMMQLPAGEDFVIATGKGHTAGEFAETAFDLVGLDWRDHVRTNASLLRESRPPIVGDPSRFQQACGWTEEREFRELIRLLMIDAGGQEFLT